MSSLTVGLVNEVIVIISLLERLVKKGRHRRFEEARSLKRLSVEEVRAERCPECGAVAPGEHASWCLAEEYGIEEAEGVGAGADVDADGEAPLGG